MEKSLNISAFGTVPVLVFHRLSVVDKTRTSIHVIVFDTPAAARAKAAQILENSDLELVAVVDAVVR